jgi:transposase
MAKVTRYSDEFKSSSVDLYLKSGESALKISKDLGICDATLSKWVTTYREMNNLISTSKETPEEEIKRLKRENHLLKMERDILKKATAYFAKETL